MGGSGKQRVSRTEIDRRPWAAVRARRTNKRIGFRGTAWSGVDCSTAAVFFDRSLRRRITVRNAHGVFVNTVARRIRLRGRIGMRRFLRTMRRRFTWRYAPLLLIPVALSRNTGRSKFRLRLRDDKIVTNLSIQSRLQQDFGIRLPDVPESPADEENWSPTTYFDSIRELVDDRDDWEVMDDEILLWFFRSQSSWCPAICLRTHEDCNEC